MPPAGELLAGNVQRYVSTDTSLDQAGLITDISTLLPRKLGTGAGERPGQLPGAEKSTIRDLPSLAVQNVDRGLEN